MKDLLSVLNLTDIPPIVYIDRIVSIGPTFDSRQKPPLIILVHGAYIDACPPTFVERNWCTLTFTSVVFW